MKRLIAVSLIGIPASGKTSLARKILEFSRIGHLKANVVVITFDNFININFNEIATGDYKRSREKLLHDVEGLIQTLNKIDENFAEALSSSELKLDSTCFNFNIDRPTIIVLDDNMYYRSMRQRVRSICRSTNCGHFQIFVKCSLELAIQRNLKRSSPIPESIINDMYHHLEEPHNLRTIICVSDLPDSDLVEMINERIENSESLEESAEHLSLPQQQSLLHQIDIISRKELSLKIKSLKSNEDVSSRCATLNKRRKKFLEDFRSESLEKVDVESIRSAFQRYLDE